MTNAQKVIAQEAIQLVAQHYVTKLLEKGVTAEQAEESIKVNMPNMHRDVAELAAKAELMLMGA